MTVFCELVFRIMCLHGQAVKTLPSQGRNRGSIPLGGVSKNPLQINGLQGVCFYLGPTIEPISLETKNTRYPKQTKKRWADKVNATFDRENGGESQ